MNKIGKENVMIKHIVMWQMKENALGKSGQENARVMQAMLSELPQKIDLARKLEVSCNIFEATPACDILLYAEFASKEDLHAYAVHPEHLRCVDFIKQVVAGRSVVDYEV